MSIGEQLKRERDVSELKEKLRVINNNLSYYQTEMKNHSIAIEAYDLLRLEVLQELADLGEISHASIS